MNGLEGIGYAQLPLAGKFCLREFDLLAGNSPAELVAMLGPVDLEVVE